MDLIQIGKKPSENRLVFTKNEISNHIWLADLTYTQQQISSESMPYAIAGIATFAEKNLNLDHPIKLFKYPENFIDTIKENGVPEIIGFSNYMWNKELSLSFARRIKELSPDTIIVMGGPNYPVNENEQKNFLENNTEIDFYVIGEGEIAFTNLINELSKNNFEKSRLNYEIPSVHYKSQNNEFYFGKTIDRLKDLSEIPSPYITKKLDRFFDGRLQPCLQTTRGCPFTCTFCVEGLEYYSKVNRNTSDRIEKELIYIGEKMADSKKIGGRNDLWLVDSNFGMYSQDIDTATSISKCQEKFDWPEYIQCDTGKNNKQRVLDAAKLVKGAIRLSGSVQTLDPSVLKNIKRSNISGDQLMQLAVEASEVEADSRSEIILGLPGESKDTHFKTIETVINSGFNKIDNYQLMLLPGTEVNTPETKSNFKMKSKFRVLPRCFGYFDFMGKIITAAEIEEICISTNTLSFTDYLECRKLHLIIHIFYNDGIFDSTMKFLKSLNIPIFRWLQLLTSMKPEESLAKLFESFETLTNTELWDDKQKLKEFVNDPKILDDYISGKIGYNLLFVHKSKAIVENMLELWKLAQIASKKLLEEFGENNTLSNKFLDEVLHFDLLSSSNIFEKLDTNPESYFSYDIKKFSEDSEIRELEFYQNKSPTKYHFIHSSKQKDILERAIKLYSNDELGISRILTKVFVKKLRRIPMTDNSVN